jgi:ubiquinone/menaquinone biosynthesis C-methylase UbiE
MAQIKMENNKYYFDQLGDNFEKFMDDYDVSRRCCLIFDILLKEIDFNGKKVLEVGSGTGRISREILSRKADLTILDIGENLVQQVSKKLGCKGIAGDACALPFEDQTFDLVISSECIEHTENPLRAIQEMCRVCRKNGVVCITSPNKLWYPILWLSIKTGIRKFCGIENWLFPNQAQTTMKNAGMSDFGMAGCHLWPFQLKFSRGILKWIDTHLGKHLYGIMINYGIRGRKV